MPEIQEAELDQIESLTEMWHEFMEYHRELREGAYDLREGATEAIHDRFREYITGARKRVLIVTTPDRPAGFAVARIEEASNVFDVGPKARITDFYLRREVRGQGVGRELVRDVSAWGREQNAEKLFMSIDANNEAGRKFWEALDFERTKETYQIHLP